MVREGWRVRWKGNHCGFNICGSVIIGQAAFLLACQLFISLHIVNLEWAINNDSETYAKRHMVGISNKKPREFWNKIDSSMGLIPRWSDTVWNSSSRGTYCQTVPRNTMISIITNNVYRSSQKRHSDWILCQHVVDSLRGFLKELFTPSLGVK